MNPIRNCAIIEHPEYEFGPDVHVDILSRIAQAERFVGFREFPRDTAISGGQYTVTEEDTGIDLLKENLLRQTARDRVRRNPNWKREQELALY